MPLEPGTSHEVISRNIATERNAGKSASQAAAIAYSVARGDSDADPVPAKAAGILFISPQGNGLFLKRSDASDHAGEWCFPGGGKEADETAEQTAIREAIEEIGFLPKGERSLLARQITGGTPPGVAGAAPLPLPSGNAAPVVIQAPNAVDFTTFVQRVGEQFEPKINDSEHTGYAWAPIGDPPEPLHPGCRIALRMLGADELACARAMAAGELISPWRYSENLTLVALRITGTGIAYRSRDNEFVHRDPAIYLNDEFLARCNGLDVIVDHPEKATLNSDEYMNRVVGSIFLPYICGNEVWGIAKIRDAATANMVAKHQLSTSPTVVFRNPKVTNTKVELEDGSKLLFEGKPELLDHVAICLLGVWDKGNGPSGVKSETRSDSAMTPEEMKAKEDAARADKAKADAAEKEKADKAAADKAAADKAAADADGGTEMDKMLKGIADALGGISKRMDSFEEKEKAKDDKAKADAEAEEKDKKEKADKAKADAEEEARKNGDAKQLAADKAKKDADDKAEREKEKADAEATRKKIADLEAAIKPRADGEAAEMADAQAKADSVYQMHGKRAPQALVGENLLTYRRRMATELKAHSDRWKDADLAAIADSAALSTIEAQIYADAQLAALKPTGLPEGELRPMRHVDVTGRVSTTFVGQPRAWMRNFSANRRRVSGIRNQS